MHPALSSLHPATLLHDAAPLRCRRIWLRRRKRYQAQAALNRGEKAAFASLHEVALGDNGKGPPDSGSADGGHGGHKPVVLAEDSGHSTLADADRPTNSSQHRSQVRQWAK